ncbi:type II methionyl aminopeptidase [Candidatus Pacearchaeota archaeon]|nr:type II methionyl aminopeptidase [Candidatus Pacearchaeota archaeon]
MDIEKLKRAGAIAKEVVAYARGMVKKGMPLLEIADKIESKIRELKANPAFPVNLSINEIAAHATPSANDETRASGLLKIDIGVHIDGYVADTAFSLDLEGDEENKRLIAAAEEALKHGVKEINIGTPLKKIGKAIESAIKSYNVQPIQNLSGHSIEQYDLHSGITIPNYDNHQETEIAQGVYAIEPFATSGLGEVKDGKPSGIYHLEKPGNVRDSFAREVLAFIEEEYATLPFCSRWIHHKFGSRGLIALKRIEEAGLLHHYSQLVEKSGKKVAQAEHTVLLTKKEKIVTTL